MRFQKDSLHFPRTKSGKRHCFLFPAAQRRAWWPRFFWQMAAQNLVKRKEEVMKRYFILGAMMLALVAQAVAQGRGNRGGGAGSAGQRTGAGQPAMTHSGSSNAQQDQLRTRQQDRQRIHATTQQRDQYRDCQQSASQLRNQVRQMKELSNRNQIKAENREQLREGLRTQTQAMQRDHDRLMTQLREQDRLMNQLDEQQKARVQKAVRDANAHKQQLTEFSDALEFELQQEELNRERISTQAERMETSLGQLQKQYRTMNDELQLD
jgi:chromosome segregation ATPase